MPRLQNRTGKRTESRDKDRTNNSGVVFPSQIANLVLRFDASDPHLYSDAGTTLCVNGAVVQQWNDISAVSNKNLTAATTARPLYNTNVQNGLPAVTFNDGSANHTANWMQTATFTLAQPMHVFIVFKRVSYTASARIFDGYTADSELLYQAPDASSVGIFAGAGTLSTGIANNTSMILDCMYSSPNSYIRVNNASKTGPAAIGTTSSAGFTLGAGGNALNFSYVNLFEVIIYSAILSDANAALVNHYLGAKWGIATS